MSSSAVAVILLIPLWAAWAQEPATQGGTPSPPQASGELTAPWTVREDVAALCAQVEKLKPLMDKISIDHMTREGAPASYGDVLKSAQDQLEYLLGTAQKLRTQPDALSIALETYFRLESLEGLIGSTIEGVRRYQSPDLAHMLRAAITDSANGRERLKQYMVELASNRENEFRIMDQEAQRCRQGIARQQQPPTAKPRTRKGTSK